MKTINWLNQNQGFVMAILTLVYVAATIVIAWLTLRMMQLGQQNLAQALALEKNRIRPYVLFNFVSDIEKRNTLATVKNAGLTPAYNVKVSIAPKLMHKGNPEERESALTAHKINLLPAGEVITDNLGFSPHFYQQYPQPIFSGTIEYEDSESNSYKESFSFDLTYLMKRIYIRDGSVMDELKKLNETLANIDKRLLNRQAASVSSDEVM